MIKVAVDNNLRLEYKPQYDRLIQVFSVSDPEASLGILSSLALGMPSLRDRQLDRLLDTVGFDLFIRAN